MNFNATRWDRRGAFRQKMKMTQNTNRREHQERLEISAGDQRFRHWGYCLRNCVLWQHTWAQSGLLLRKWCIFAMLGQFSFSNIYTTQHTDGAQMPIQHISSLSGCLQTSPKPGNPTGKSIHFQSCLSALGSRVSWGLAQLPWPSWHTVGRI